MQSSRSRRSTGSGIRILPPTEKRGFGGFPGPIQLSQNLLKRFFPKAHRKIERKLTMPRTITLSADQTPWLNFDLNAGPNSDFHTDSLTDDQLEQIGGAEYKALRILSYYIPAVCVYLNSLWHWTDPPFSTSSSLNSSPTLSSPHGYRLLTSTIAFSKISHAWSKSHGTCP